MAEGDFRLMDLFVALIHYPVVDKHKTIITSSVTNLDLHDIARSCCTYGVKKYFVVHPSEDEQALNRRIVSHWDSGCGRLMMTNRAQALETLELAYDFTTVKSRIKEMTGKDPLIIGTSARVTEDTIKMPEFRKKIGDRPVLLVFGTAYGLAPSWNQELEGFLEPIHGPTDFNHLSVRSAVAIYLDRIQGSEASSS
jgi:hypothetical protein